MSEGYQWVHPGSLPPLITVRGQRLASTVGLQIKAGFLYLEIATLIRRPDLDLRPGDRAGQQVPIVVFSTS